MKLLNKTLKIRAAKLKKKKDILNHPVRCVKLAKTRLNCLVHCISPPNRVIHYINISNTHSELFSYLCFSWGYIIIISLFHRKLSLQQKSSAGDVNLYWRCGSNTEQNITTDDASHYQDLCVSRNENTYQTIDQQWLLKNKLLNCM